MFKHPFFIFFFFVFLTVQGQDKEKKTLTTRSFTGLKVYSGLHLNLIPSDVNKAVVSGPQSDDVVLTIKKNTLNVKLAIGSLEGSEPTTINLYHSKNLHKIQAFNESIIQAEDQIQQTSILLESKTNAFINLDVITDRLDVIASTGGRINLRGATTALNLKVNLGGSCEAEELLTSQITAKLIGGGYAYVSVSELIDANVAGGSVLRVFGNPKKRIYQEKLGGKLFFEE